MIWVVIACGTGVVLFIAGGWEDEHHARAQARREMERARQQELLAPPTAYREAHARRHAASRWRRTPRGRA